MTLLESVHGPADLKRMNQDQLGELAAEIRDFLVEKVRLAGGHLGPNLGVVELTMALHRVFDSPDDAIVWDVGHQAYVHKIVTGRHDGFGKLRQLGGLTGYPARCESEHDLVENSHASTALSYVDGLAKAFELEGGGRHAIAVVGDGALTGGMCWEALNNIAANPRRPVVIVINDNGRSYSPTIGGVADHLASLRLKPGYERVLDRGKELLRHTPVVGKPIYAALHAAKAGLKDALSPQMMFSDLGLKYLGPVDGHDLAALEKAFQSARDFGGAVIVHVVTEKGHGYEPAVTNQADQMHQTDPIDPETGLPPVKGPSWTGVFADEMVKIGADREDVVAITAAMLRSTGLHKFAEAYPDRWYDVGIAEQHAVTSAAGLAMGGKHPVVAVYSTFLNRAFDQVLMDVALHRQPVTLVLDRAGITGPDGPSHHGMWDLSLLGMVPGMRVAAPRDAGTLREELREAVAVEDGPTALRFSKGGVIDSVPAVERVGTVDVLRKPAGDADVLLVAVGAFAMLGLAAADRLADQGIGVTVVDPRWVVPAPAELVALAEQHKLVVTVEDSGRHGGFGSALAALFRDAECDVPLRDLAVPQVFHDHGSREEVLARVGLTAQDVARRVTEWSAKLASRTPAPEDTRR
ncbi:1-deoxy-D-xylulose-5-phosphate synthase [Amycolatopsis keratiniphila]|uniref:1-deoxy-D-xylulose-5-phosphate synthase n=2 Tax=Amycolatopsis keratiniphila TaxID=129921 RepID=R4SYE8_9PSEU|nr:1-deoxy-D-xylulose-5-phosphate synthase [Amycolatopsis keratiniphila]AGM05191.1 1-deoxy-D-xylulose-5-phosphate synthase [Amycolatopsis keratiniphila]OLZ53872.1 1-deoxy-D-xylulose-5-phosphate synthase [Amycolatopsis keratiniphila subsp. nogabecina]ONF64186.1 1-deoxy-D-xylulose-5-phosphate synthase [Amycolatopsis keratiniphila subsp. keratiniphila]SDU33561.1 1-deoxy-D-xylulose-5-phosphate synthase [Amycolatopsis keratiniphila]